MNIFSDTYSLPFNAEIPTKTQEFLDNELSFKRKIKFYKRKLYLFLTRQSNLEQTQILEEQKNILWINLSAISLGDSLMDLSGRVLLKDKSIDLFTHKKNAHVYKCDSIFQNVITSISDVSQKYDLVIIDSYSTRSIKVKYQALKDIPFVGVYGYYNGPEVNRVLFSFHKLNKLLGYRYHEDYINSIAKNSINICKKDIAIINHKVLPKGYISIVIGGEWEYRTYNNWQKVINAIITQYPQLNIVLVGSQNGEKHAKTLDNHHNIINLVNQFSFTQTVEIINQSKLLLCCDGGLMHGANAAGTPIVVLFAKLTPKMQLTQSIVAFSLVDDFDVNNINYKLVVNKVNEALKSIL